MPRPDYTLATQPALPNWAPLNAEIRRPETPLPAHIPQYAKVKWGSVTHVLPHRAETWSELRDNLLSVDRDPRANDVVLGRIVDIGRHGAVELACGRKADLHLGDLIVGAFGNRYATNQYEGRVPPRLDYYHMLSQGAVFGQVVSAPYSISDPTVIEPLGFLNDGTGAAINLSHFGLMPLALAELTPTLLVLGSSMDAGKTTTAATLVRGLSLAGWRVHAGKLTGTGCAKDIHKMRDAGAQKVLDFTHCGYAATAATSDQELDAISSRLIEHLSQEAPDILILEIADGIVQTETDRLAKMLSEKRKVDGVILAIHDVLSAGPAAQLIEHKFGLPLFGVSGAVTHSPLSTDELRRATTLPVYAMPDLADPMIALAMEDFLAKSPRQAAHPSLKIA